MARVVIGNKQTTVVANDVRIRVTPTLPQHAITKEYFENMQHFTYTGNSSAQWDITHNLNRFPSVSVVDTMGSIHQAEVSHINENRLIINFSSPFSVK